MTMPSGLPTLSAGAHSEADGKACVMEYVAFLNGEEWSDSPACTHPVLAAAARQVNDGLRDCERHVLVPLIGRLFGTQPPADPHDDYVLTVKLAIWSAEQVIDFTANRQAAQEAIDAAKRQVNVSETDARGLAEARATLASAAHNASAACEQGGRVNNRSSESAMSAIYWATQTAILNHARHTAASTAIFYALCIVADTAAFLTGLIVEYDRLTGRTESRELSMTELDNLRTQVEQAA